MRRGLLLLLGTIFCSWFFALSTSPALAQAKQCGRDQYVGTLGTANTFCGPESLVDGVHAPPEFSGCSGTNNTCYMDPTGLIPPRTGIACGTPYEDSRDGQTYPTFCGSPSLEDGKLFVGNPPGYAACPTTGQVCLINFIPYSDDTCGEPYVADEYGTVYRTTCVVGFACSSGTFPVMSRTCATTEVGGATVTPLCCGSRAGEKETKEIIEGGPKLGAFDYCKQVPDGDQRRACEECLSQGGTSEDGTQKTVYTAVGCIHTGEDRLVADLITLFLGVSGGIALLSILAASFLFSTSRGDTNKVKQAKDLMTAAVSGLFFIIFSVIILNFIGVQILRIPGLS